MRTDKTTGICSLIAFLLLLFAFPIFGEEHPAKDATGETKVTKAEFQNWQKVPVQVQTRVGGDMPALTAFRITEKLEFAPKGPGINIAAPAPRKAIETADYEKQCVLILWGPRKTSITRVNEAWLDKKTGRLVVVVNTELNDSDIGEAGIGSLVVVDKKFEPQKVIVVDSSEKQISATAFREPILVNKSNDGDFFYLASQRQKK